MLTLCFPTKAPFTFLGISWRSTLPSMNPENMDMHKEKAARRQQAFEKRKAQATHKKGLIIVHTGAGKGKTTAALGLAFRALGQGLKVAMVQFIKGAIPTGEA